MIKRCFLIAMMLLLLKGCDSVRYDDVLGIRSDSVRIVSVYDDHGGFHGDGVRVETVFCPEDAFCGAISDRAEWRPLPLSADVKQLLRRFFPFLTEEIRGALISVPQDGYWFFRDRHDKAVDSTDVSAAIGRSSYNFSFAIYDLKTQMLYYLEIDT